MVDRAKELYQQQLAAHAAWANFGASSYSGASHSSPFGAPGSGASTNPYQDYVQRLQHLSGQLGHNNPGVFGGNFLGNGTKDMSGFASPFGFPPGHTMHFPNLGGYSPLAAHSTSLPAHIKRSSPPPSTPVPAHMRSSPYSQASYQPSPYSSPYSVPGYGASQPPQAPINPTHYSDPNDQTQRQTQTQTPMHNGSSSTSMSSFFPSGVTSAYTQLLQSTAFSQASTTASKKSSPDPTSANNNNPYISHATTNTATSNLSLHSQPNTRSSSQHSYDDQVAAALLDRFGGQFNSQLMSEMTKTAKAIPAASIYPAAPNPTKASLGEKEFNISKKTHIVVAQTSRSSSPQQKHQDLKVSNPEISDFKSEVMQHGNDVENHQNPNVINSNTAVHNSSRPGPHPSNSTPMSITNKIKDLERKLASTSTSRHNSASSLSNDDRSELKGLWKMQANLFKQKLQSTSASQNSSHTSSTLVNSLASSDPKNVTSSASVSLTVSSNTASPRKSVSRPDQIPETVSLVPPLIHTPRSPPHPPPPLLSYNHSQAKPYANKPLFYTPPSHPYSSSSHTPQYLPRIQGPPSPSNDEPPVPSSDNKTISMSPQLSIQNDRMEVKNSGIPGPSAISWKRKSEDSPTVGNLSKKRRPCDGDTLGNLDPYSFDDDSDKGRATPGRTEINNDFTNGSEPCKFKQRDNEAESDESSLSRSSSPAKMKKRPKMEEWSVNKEKEKSLKSTKKTERQCSKNESVAIENSSLWRLSSNNKALGVGNIVSTTTTKDSEKSSIKSSVTNAKVWLKAFGASDLEEKECFKNSTDSEKNISKIPKEPGTSSSTILEIPPEVRRKPRPKFGGLIHFDSDWNHGVRRHHERCRVPSSIENSASLKPKILAGVQTPKKSYEDHARKAMVSPPNMILLEKERLEKAALNVAPKLPPSFSNDDELSGELPSIVETILENRKKLREATGSRIYKVPFMKEKKKRTMRAPVHTEIRSGPIGLLPTPGLPPFTTDNKDVLLGTEFGNFRHYTFENFIQKGKTTELLSSKKRHNHSSKSVLTFREIFGLEIKKEKIKEGKKFSEDKSAKDRSSVDKGKNVSSNDRLIKKESFEGGNQTLKKDKPGLTGNFEAHLKTSSKKDKKSSTTRELIKSAASLKPGRKNDSNFSPKFRASTLDNNPPLTIEDEFGYSQEVGDPSDREKNLHFDLGAFALDLLEDNPSWSKQVAIQNLVIWEPTEPEIPEPSSKKKKGKKKKARKSGMDFQSSKKKSKNIVTSRAGSLSTDGDVCQVVYSLDNVIAESSRWVIDKNAGETILHRASKMGYPDVAAYALDMADTTAGERDYAGLTPLHKAALKGNFNVARILLSYGSDPGAGVKGTRALHEAIEGGEPNTARVLLCYGADPLLHDYSGNMPVDLATDRNMQQYFNNILADLHGKVPPRAKSDTRFSTTQLSRWNVTHCTSFHTPPSCLLTLNQERKIYHRKKEAFMFDASSQVMPISFKLKDREGEWMLYRDIRDYSKRSGTCHEDIRKKGKLIEMKKSDFLKHSHCQELDKRKVEVRFHERSTEDIVILVKIDKFIRKVINSNITEVN